MFNLFFVFLLIKNLNKFKFNNDYFFVKIFFLLFIFNIISIIPYRLSITTLTTNLILSFLSWFIIFYYFLYKNINKNIAHFLPQRAPIFIISILVIIESISILIRPLSLRIRLISNITSRHLVIHLISEATRLFSLGLVFLIIFEFFVCFIQSYIFFLLLNIYKEEIV